MSEVTKNVVLKAIIDGAIAELMVKSVGDNVYLSDGTTLSSKIAEMVTAINARAKSEDVVSQIDALRQEMLGDTPVEAYNTFTELAAYIKEHQEISDSLTAAIGNKADKSVVDGILTTISTLGALANKSTVSETDLDTDLQNKINTAADSGHTHNNKTVLDGITADQVSGWDAKTKVYVSATQPENLTANDIWIQTL